MATTNKKIAENNDYSMQERIRALYELQKIDSKIDEINKVKGELPMEVADLEDEVAGLQTRIDNIQSEIDELNALLRQAKEEIEQNKAMIVKYTEQQNNVRNNREFDAIGKEIEYQELQNQLCEKHIKEYNAALKVKKQLIEEAEATKADRCVDLEAKREELNSIDAETAKKLGMDRSTVHRHFTSINETVYEKLKYAVDVIYAGEKKQEFNIFDKRNSSQCSHINSEKIARRLKALREEQFMTVEMLSEKIGISPDRIIAAEARGGVLTMAELKRLISYYKVSCNYIIFGTD
jgi:predicted  nucleic acid-binding Zn-ribbon protein/DNA-binding XRE family transcriptional regulator